MLEQDPLFATNAIHQGNSPSQWASHSVTPMISQSSTYKLKNPGQDAKHRDGLYNYGRHGNPSRQVLETCIATLEHAKHCVTFSSGMAAIANVGHLAKNGDHVVCMHDVYGGTRKYFANIASGCGVETDFVDLMTTANLKPAIKKNTTMIFMESPTNPCLNIANIAKLCQVVDRYHKENPNQKKPIVVIDNTFASPYCQNPLDLGVDIVVHAVTKYINGHSDVTMGAAMTNSDELNDILSDFQSDMGSIPGPLDCFLANRGVKTLNIRMEQHEINAMAVAKALEADDRVEKVLYPGLPSHPGHRRAKHQMKGYSGMVSFYIRGDGKTAEKFLTSVETFSLANSLGGYESLCSQPATMSHRSLSQEDRDKLGISDNLIRLAVGLESLQTLLDDLSQALGKAVPASAKKHRKQ